MILRSLLIVATPWCNHYGAIAQGDVSYVEKACHIDIDMSTHFACLCQTGMCHVNASRGIAKGDVSCVKKAYHIDIDISTHFACLRACVVCQRVWGHCKRGRVICQESISYRYRYIYAFDVSMSNGHVSCQRVWGHCKRGRVICRESMSFRYRSVYAFDVSMSNGHVSCVNASRGIAKGDVSCVKKAYHIDIHLSTHFTYLCQTCRVSKDFVEIFRI